MLLYRELHNQEQDLK